MSNGETFFKDASLCPCGSGKIVSQTTVPDNQWSKTFTSFAVECTKCFGKFHARDGRIVNIQDERRKMDALGKKLEAEETLVMFMAPDIESYFSSGRYKSKAAEHREMLRLNLSPRSLVSYRKERNEAKHFWETCHPAKNRKWLMELAIKSGKQEQLQTLLRELDERSKAYDGIDVEVHLFSV